MHSETWPLQIPVGSRRLWDAQTGWSQIETDAGSYDFTALDHAIAEVPAAADIYYTFGRTPHFYSSDPTDSACGYSNTNDPTTFGQCHPPTDVALDGGSTFDAVFQGFVRALMNHVCVGAAPNKTCRIQYYETWNEPNTDEFWAGNYVQLARMASDAAAIIKGQCSKCLVTTPAVSAGGDGYHANGDSGTYSVWMQNFLSAWETFGHLPDVGAWHPYPARTNVVPPPFPETNLSETSTYCNSANTSGAGVPPNKYCRDSVLTEVTTLRAIFNAHGLSGKPMVASEGSWGLTSGLPAAQQPAFLARWYILLASAGVSRTYWYAYDNASWGTLFNAQQGLLSPGQAYKQVASWLTGSTFVSPCALTAGTDIYSCELLEGDGTSTGLVWSTSGTPSYAVPAAFTRFTDLTGADQAVVSGHITLGAAPVLLH